jgi:hypothetical protein
MAAENSRSITAGFTIPSPRSGILGKLSMKRLPLLSLFVVK